MSKRAENLISTYLREQAKQEGKMQEGFIKLTVSAQDKGRITSLLNPKGIMTGFMDSGNGESQLMIDTKDISKVERLLVGAHIEFYQSH